MPMTRLVLWGGWVGPTHGWNFLCSSQIWYYFRSDVSGINADSLITLWPHIACSLFTLRKTSLGFLRVNRLNHCLPVTHTCPFDFVLASGSGHQVRVPVLPAPFAGHFHSSCYAMPGARSFCGHTSFHHSGIMLNMGYCTVFCWINAAWINTPPPHCWLWMAISQKRLNQPHSN